MRARIILSACAGTLMLRSCNLLSLGIHRSSLLLFFADLLLVMGNGSIMFLKFHLMALVLFFQGLGVGLKYALVLVSILSWWHALLLSNMNEIDRYFSNNRFDFLATIRETAHECSPPHRYLKDSKLRCSNESHQNFSLISTSFHRIPLILTLCCACNLQPTELFLHLCKILPRGTLCKSWVKVGVLQQTWVRELNGTMFSRNRDCRKFSVSPYVQNRIFRLKFVLGKPFQEFGTWFNF